MTITLFGERLLVNLVKENNSEVNGIYIGEEKTKENIGEIVQVGDGLTDGKFKVGQFVLFNKHSVLEILTDEGAQYILDEKHIYGIVEGKL